MKSKPINKFSKLLVRRTVIKSKSFDVAWDADDLYMEVKEVGSSLV